MTNTPGARQRLLVAGPDTDDRELTVRSLIGLGYDVVARAPSGLEAIGAAARYRPDLVFVESTLPGPLDGPGTARAIDEIYGIPAVVVKARKKGAGRIPSPLPYVVLRKPFDLDDMDAAVRRALRRPTPERDRGLDREPGPSGEHELLGRSPGGPSSSSEPS